MHYTLSKSPPVFSRSSNLQPVCSEGLALEFRLYYQGLNPEQLKNKPHNSYQLGPQHGKPPEMHRSEIFKHCCSSHSIIITSVASNPSWRNVDQYPSINCQEGSNTITNACYNQYLQEGLQTLNQTQMHAISWCPQRR
jgi:hypothetical protein